MQLLNEAGVALVFMAHFAGSGVSGAVRWINKVPVIQLSLYYSWADIFWFNLFHEIGHLLLHGRKGRFLEFDRKELAVARSKEDEADEFATNELIPPKRYAELLEGPLSRKNIADFASNLGIHPGIVGGRLCHDKKIGWNAVSTLRTRLTLV
jgi:HTH-type transcriptional regulator/antitoxin HigA